MNSHNIETTSTINQFGLVVLVVYLLTLNKTLMPKQTPLEKANELINKFEIYCDGDAAVMSAMFVVKEVLKADPYQYIKDYYQLVADELEEML